MGASGQQHWMFLGRNTQFVVKSVMPDLFHVIPICNHPMLDGVSESQYTTLGLRLVTDI